MKILVLEDNSDRIEKFKKELAGHIVDYSETAFLAEKLLDCNSYDLIFLDHDLGGECGADSNDRNTGYQVAKHLSNTKNKNTFVIIHSCNPVGASNMKSVVQNGELVPFLILDIKGAVEIVPKRV